MKKQLDLVAEFHQKFNAPILDKPSLIPNDRSTLRHQLMNEEVNEYQGSVSSADLPNLAKELADILYTTFGTILEHGLQDKIEEIFSEVHRSNMSKQYHEYKMIKGEGYIEADIKQLLK